jgi:hypothetical protein
VGTEELKDRREAAPPLWIKFAVLLEDYDLPEVPARPHGPLFHRWLPNGQVDAIALHTGHSSTSLKVWFERLGFIDDGMVRFAYDRREVADDVIPQQAILDGGPLIGLLEMTNVPADEMQCLEDNAVGSDAYVALGKRIVTTFLHPCISRFLNFVRTRYGQYWLRPLKEWDARYESLGAYCQYLDLQWSLDRGATWKSFEPDTPVGHLTVTIRETFVEYLTKQDWSQLSEVRGARDRPSPAALALTDAHRSEDQGHTSYAFLHGVTALELAVGECLRRQVTSPELKKLVECVWDLPLPARMVLLSSSFPGIDETGVELAAKAIKTRNRFVHEGVFPSDASKGELRGLFRTIACLLASPEARFPSANPGNASMSEEKWDQ